MYYARPMLHFGNRNITEIYHISILKHFCHLYFDTSRSFKCHLFDACAANNSYYAIQLYETY